MRGMIVTCKQCGETFQANGQRGVTPTYCSARCRQRACRARKAGHAPVEYTHKCKCCGHSFTAKRRDHLYCSTRCRVTAYLRRKRASGSFPPEMTSCNRWVRAVGKRPIQVTGAPASSTKPETWAAFSDVKAASVGNGFGIMLGGGLGCYDLDHHTDSEARAFIAGITEPIVFIERSVSGHGVHVFIRAEESKGYRHGRVERYTRSRFIRTTGNVFA